MIQQDFTHVQLIAYEIATKEPFEAVKHSPTEDMEKKAKHLYTLMEGIQNVYLLNPYTLKIFVVPEFYFRSFSGKPDGTGHYTWSDVTLGIRALKDDCKKSGKFKDWLVVPGTSIHTETCRSTRAIFAQLHIFTGGGDIDLTLNKQNFSSIDNLDDIRNGAAAQIVSEALAQGFVLLGAITPEYKPVQIAKNVRVGFEICLDHGEQRLRKYVTSPSTPDEDKNIDVHVLTACGRQAIPTAVTTRNFAYFFRCDGHPASFGSQSIQVQWKDKQATTLTQTAQVYLSGKSQTLNRTELTEDEQIDTTHQGDPNHLRSALTVYEEEPLVT